MTDKLYPFKRPVEYDDGLGAIFDAEGCIILDLSRWNMMQDRDFGGLGMSESEAQDKQDEIGRYIADLINADGGE